MTESHITEKDGKIQVSVEYIEWLESERRKINKVDLNDVEFYKNGLKIEVPPKRIKRWKFVGMTNICFILTNFYAENGEDDDFWQEVE